LSWCPALAVRPLLGGTVALLVLGGFSALKVYGMAEADDLGTEWTGAITAYHLGTQPLIYAFALSWLIYLRTGRPVFVAVMGIALLFMAPGLMAGVKRNVIFELAFVFAAGLHFARGVRLNRLALVAACIFATVLVHQVGAVRHYMNEGHGNAVQAVVSGVMFERFEYFNLERAPELSQAVSDIAIYNENRRFDGFAHHWNKLVHQYVPAFLLGRETKDNLKVDVMGGYGDATANVYFSRGATRTGFSDSFRGFWLFGTVIFLVIGWVFGRLCTSSLDGNLPAQFYYLVLFSDGPPRDHRIDHPLHLANPRPAARYTADLPFRHPWQKPSHAVRQRSGADVAWPVTQCRSSETGTCCSSTSPRMPGAPSRLPCSGPRVRPMAGAGRGRTGLPPGSSAGLPRSMSASV
jgi:hypothetical protein